MTKAVQYRIKEAEIKIIEICRLNGSDAIQLSDISLKLSNIKQKENERIFNKKDKVNEFLLLA